MSRAEPRKPRNLTRVYKDTKFECPINQYKDHKNFIDSISHESINEHIRLVELLNAVFDDVNDREAAQETRAEESTNNLDDIRVNLPTSSPVDELFGDTAAASESISSPSRAQEKLEHSQDAGEESQEFHNARESQNARNIDEEASVP